VCVSESDLHLARWHGSKALHDDHTKACNTNQARGASKQKRLTCGGSGCGLPGQTLENRVKLLCQIRSQVLLFQRRTDNL
jgi:hypothetical protein